MQDFVEFKSAVSKEPVFIHPDSIDGMIPLPNHCCTIYTRGGKHFQVKHSCEQVMFLLQQHEKQRTP